MINYEYLFQRVQNHVIFSDVTFLIFKKVSFFPSSPEVADSITVGSFVMLVSLIVTQLQQNWLFYVT